MKKSIFSSVFIVCLLLISFIAEAANQINSVRTWPSPDKTRVVFELQNKPNYTHFFLTSPNRLVIDIADTGKKFNLSEVKVKGDWIKKIRYSKPKKKGWRRIVLDLSHPLAAKVFSLPPTEPYGDRLVIDLISKNLKPATRRTVEPTGERGIIVAIDAGHGGEDPGAIGPSGLYEKKVAFQVAKRLASLVNKQKGMQAFMVRTGDYYVGLNERTEKARKAKADILISVHADAFTSPKPRGASVWMLSMRRANTEIGRWLEKREKHSDLLGGAAEVINNTQNEKYLAKVLLDMSMEHSIATSFEVSQNVVNELKKVTKLHQKRPQSASFAVLKSPDIPSILVETGFISNPKEERLLSQKEHQTKLATAVFKGVNQYFIANPPDGTLYAKLYSRSEHIVRSGESLSVLAQRYQVSVSALKKANNLRKDTLFIGQKLTIPQT
ncbi:N-acetylmuramoyl-L-alanine amidase [Catenovulum sp. SM1970]|uniref:N-acetylmuramoyl-L-alanine amidase n=1 Tax=Marinifaba aquimaris TaxID=2741323 RepID=UPI001573CA27|nr:N-acetylmuramoyl-L-alanine amidase [Marinifaba aquimaris]NTS77470.1 N-acetylmuramoyl-L-alanine amidase [Marinifaba aquimaris]